MLIPSFVNAQNSREYLDDKPGKLVIENMISKCPGQDVTALTKNLTSIVEWVRLNNSIINAPLGFDAFIHLSENYNDKKIQYEEYGITCGIDFSFHYFYMENGVFKTATAWSAHGTKFYINNPLALIATQFDEGGFESDDPPQLKDTLEKALKNLKRYYAINPVEKEIAPGVRLYAGGYILVFNPNRPDFYIPVTVKEIMEAMLDYYKISNEIDSLNVEKNQALWTELGYPDLNSQLTVYEALKAEYGNFTAEELNKWAYSNAGETVSGINAQKNGAPVVRFNPDCWDKSLPTSAIQFLSIRYRPASPSELELFERNNNGLTDYVGLFYNQMPVEKLGELIQKK